MATSQNITTNLQLARRADSSSVSMSEWQVIREQAATLVKTGFLPRSIETAEQALAIILTGRELGIGPMAALSTINVIQGKPTISPQLMLALINRTGEVESLSLHSGTEGATCTIKRRGQDAYTATFGPREATAMGLAGKDNYKKQPATMYKWRAIADAARSTFPDALLGLYTPDEMGAVVDAESGAVIEAQPEPIPIATAKAKRIMPAQTVESVSERITKVEGGYDCDVDGEVHNIRKSGDVIFCTCGSRGNESQCVHRLALKLWLARQATPPAQEEPEAVKAEVVESDDDLVITQPQMIELASLCKQMESLGIAEDVWRDQLEKLTGQRTRKGLLKGDYAKVLHSFKQARDAAQRKAKARAQ